MFLICYVVDILTAPFRTISQFLAFLENVLLNNQSIKDLFLIFRK